MPNITLSIDKDLLQRARRIAFEKDTSINAMVRDHLTAIIAQESTTREDMVRRWKTSAQKHRIVIGKKTWDRENLHAR
jgi:hypothetical protein